MRPGEIVLVALIGLIGAAWILMSLDLSYMEGPVPGGGYLPFWIGIILVSLLGMHVVLSWRERPRHPAKTESVSYRKQVLIVAALFACIALIEPIGFGAAVALFIAFLLGYVERLNWQAVAGVAILAPTCLVFVFRTLLSVPLPRGPWGF